MKLEGSIELGATPEVAFDHLHDPAMLARCIPGCDDIERQADGSYRARMSAGIGAVRGRFEGTVALTDIDRPRSYTMALDGISRVGHVRGSAVIRLEATQGGTRVLWRGSGQVSGLIAAVGSRLVEVAARKLVGMFFERLAAEVG